MRGGQGHGNESPPPLDISPEPPALPLDGPTVADSPPPLDCGHAQDDDVKPPSPSSSPSAAAAVQEEAGRDAQQQHQQQQHGFVPYGPRAGRDLVDQQSSGYRVRPHEKPPPLLQATLGLAATYSHVRERRGKVRPRGGWAGTATGETRLFTSDDGTLRLGPHLPLLLGRYRFLRLVGQGTFAQILCAEDTLDAGRPHRQVAIKILNFHYGEVGKREALCLRVAHEAAEGAHAAIVRLLGAFDFMGHFCLVLELCQGGSLQAFVRPLAPPPPPPSRSNPAAASPLAAIAAVASVPTRQEPPGPVDGEGGLPLPQLREVALHLVKALLLLHNHDVIHADLKPENVLLLAPPPRGRSGSISGSLGGSGGSPGGYGGVSSSNSGGSCSTSGSSSWLGAAVRLTDLGNAIKSREVKLYKEDYEIQTLSYRAPEVLVGGCGGQAFDHRIDMWSLGVLLVELHLGRPLFRAASKMLMVKRILSVLGPLPAAPFATGKFYAALFGADHRLRPEALALKDDPAHAVTALLDPAAVQNSFRYDAGAHHRLVCDLLRTRDRNLIGFVAGLLQLDPAARLTSLQALMHPFLMPCFPFSLLRPHLAPAALADLQQEQQRRQQQGGDKAKAKPAIRPGRLSAAPAAEAAEAVVVQQRLKREAPAASGGDGRDGSGSDGSNGALSVVLEMPDTPDSDGPQPSPASTPALSLGPESPPRASDGEEGDGAESPTRQEQQQQQQGQGQRGEKEDGWDGGRKGSRKRPRDRPPAPPAAASSPAKAKASPAKSAPASNSKAAGGRKWWETGEEEDEEGEEEEDAPSRLSQRNVRQRPFAEEKAGGREQEEARHGQAAAGAGAVVVKRSSLEAAAAAEADDDISEDELIL